MYYARSPLGHRWGKRDTLLAPPNSLIIVQRCGGYLIRVDLGFSRKFYVAAFNLSQVIQFYDM